MRARKAPMQLWIGGQIWQTLRHQAEAAYPHECCGFLLGSAGQTRRCLGLVAADAPPALGFYLMQPEALLTAERVARDKDLEVIGVYHSHADTSARPSARDQIHASEFWSYLIVSCVGGKAAAARSWRWHDEEKAFEEEHVVPPGFVPP